MSGFRKLERGIQEERQFTNPHVRFRRINGRVVPIVNKKRIGQDLDQVGDTALLGGTALLGAAAFKKAIQKKFGSQKVSQFNAKARSFFRKAQTSSSSKIPSLTRSGKIVSAIGAGAKALARRPGRVGAAAALAGFALKGAGTELQLRSPFGKDFAFIKDQHGKGS